MRTGRLVIKKLVTSVHIYNHRGEPFWYLNISHRQSDVDNDSIAGFLEIFNTQDARMGYENS